MNKLDLHNIKIDVVDGPDKVAPFMEWLKTHHDYVAADTETTGLNVFEPEFKVRLVQFGDTTSGWAVPFQDWRGLVAGAFRWLSHHRVRTVWHNLAYDLSALKREGINLDLAFQDDTYVWASLCGYADQSRALKDLSVQHFGEQARFGQTLLHTAMKNAGWTWATVPIDFKPYVAYGVVDTILGAMYYDMLGPAKEKFRLQHSLEITTLDLTNRMAENGLGVNTAYALAEAEALEIEEEAVLAQLRPYGIASSGQNAKVAKVLQEANVLPEIIKLTETGQIVVDKKFLQTVDHPVARMVLQARGLHKIRGYMNAMMKAAGGAISERELIHPTIRSIEARTSRMCLPVDQMILTERGVLAWDEIKAGDRTMDRNGQWTPITAVHHYADQEVEQWKHARMTLTSTAEHRWLTSSERGVRRLEPLGAAVRRRVHLAPEVGVDAFGEQAFLTGTPEEVEASILGLLVSDGRACWEDRDQVGMHAMIYQTERKFYSQITDLLPDELVSYDRITTGDHHEIGLRARMLRPMLERHGIDLKRGQLLKTSPDLMVWALTASGEACRAFLRAVWLADGNVNHGRTVSCGTPELEEVLRVIGYRCGYSTRIQVYTMSEWSTKPRRAVYFAKAVFYNRSMDVTTHRSDVWCVSTADQTFTAWNPTYGFYLTGNSISNPALQQLPKVDEKDPDSARVRRAIVPRRDGEVLVGADFGQIELRMFGAMSKDTALLDVIKSMDAEKAAGNKNADFFVKLGQDLYDPNFKKSDPRRTKLKSTIYALLYGGGEARIAETAMVTQGEIHQTIKDLRSKYPSFGTLGEDAIRQGKQSWVVETPTGREFRVQNRSERRKLNNYRVQGASAEILKMAIINVAEAGWEDNLMLPVHDEIIMSVPEELADEAVHSLTEAMNVVVDPEDMGIAVMAAPAVSAPDWASLDH